MASSDRTYNLGDIIPPARNALSYQGKLYAPPIDSALENCQKIASRVGR